MIRDAVMEDIPTLVAMGERFRSNSPYEKYLSENPECMTRLGERLLNREGLLVSEVGGRIIGMLGFYIYRHFISDELTAGEVFWWVDKEYRGKDGIKLFLEMKRRSAAVGVKRIQMIAPSDKVADFYRRLGFEFVESTFQMNI